MSKKKISVGTWAYIWGGYSDKPIPFPTVVKKLKELKFDGIEFGAFAPHLEPNTKEKRAEIKAMLDADRTFTGLYHWNWFDAAMLLPYFAVMILLSIYGIHRYTLCYLYYKYRKNYKPDPPCHFTELPRVTVQLPIFNEQFVIDRDKEKGK